MLNNKGFAITTVLYSLLLMATLILFLLIGSLSFKRSTTNEFVNTIKNELNSYTEINKNETLFSYTGSPQTYIVPETGVYILEVWGAAGGSVNGLAGGSGGYSSGQVNLTKGEILYIYVGGKGKGATKSGEALDGGYNGGGAVTGNSSVDHINASGGGATHIAKVDGLLETLKTNQDMILIVAGGGGGARDEVNHNGTARWGTGGTGGGLTGGGAYSNYGTLNDPFEITDNAATQTSGASFGKGADTVSESAGGGGFYGGYAGDSPLYTGSGYGGSGFIGNVLNGYTTNGVQTGDGAAKITYYAS